jgi:hypothetical protein
MAELIIAILIQILTINGGTPANGEQKDKTSDKAKVETPIKTYGGGGDWKEGG